MLLAAFFLGVTVVEAVAAGPHPSPLLVAVAAVAMVGLAWRRRFPVVVAVWVMLTNLVVNPMDQYSMVFAIALVSYTLGAECARPRSVVGLALVCLPYLAAMVARGLIPSDLAAALVFVVGPWVVGVVARQHAFVADAALSRAELAAERERTRIAREMHDIVSHSISVVAIQTQAVRRRLRPDQVHEAADLAAVESTAREALAEMRRLFGVLRANGEEVAYQPQPGLADLDRLLEVARASGLEVRCRVEGSPYELTPGIDLAAYRILQEAITNVLRHAQASLVEVLVSYLPRRLDLVVRDDGRGGDLTSSGGHGLVGIRERAALYGGKAEVSSQRNGVVVRTSLPRGPS